MVETSFPISEKKKLKHIHGGKCMKMHSPAPSFPKISLEMCIPPQDQRLSKCGADLNVLKGKHLRIAGSFIFDPDSSIAFVGRIFLLLMWLQVTKGSVSYLSSPCFSTSLGGIGGPARAIHGILAVMYWISIIRGGPPPRKWS